MCGEDKTCGCAAKATGGVITADATEVSILTPDVADANGTLEAAWHACLAVEGIRTLDRRRIADGALTWRELPLAIFAQFDNAGHENAPIVGKITSVSRDDISGQIMAEGEFDLSIPEGVKAAQMCANETLRFGSIDLKVLGSRKVGIMTDLGSVDPEGGVGDLDWYDEILEGVIAGWTMIAIPAIPQAVIAPKSRPLPTPLPGGTAPYVSEGLLASGIPVKPPSEWFQDPQLSDVTPLTATDDGRVFGHLALWNTCHIGIQDQCVTPPRSTKDYAYFLTGQIETLEGDSVRVGHITYDTGHAGATMGYSETAAHYDHTGAVAADVAAGEDQFGIWVAGAIRPGVDEMGLRAIRSAPLSGDWRKIGGGLELVAALSVNVPGFPIVASAGFNQEKERVSLIAGGVREGVVMPGKTRVEKLEEEVAQLRASIQPLLASAVAELDERVNGEQRRSRRDEVEALRLRVNDAFYNKSGKNQYSKGGSSGTFHKGSKGANSSNAGVDKSKSLLNITPKGKKKKKVASPSSTVKKSVKKGTFYKGTKSVNSSN